MPNRVLNSRIGRIAFLAKAKPVTLPGVTCGMKSMKPPLFPAAAAV